MGGDLTSDEISVIRGALDLTSKTARSECTPLDKVGIVVVRLAVRCPSLTTFPFRLAFARRHLCFRLICILMKKPSSKSCAMGIAAYQSTSQRIPT